jgi:glycosyltransferase involved in cell wall biosynthesis
MKVELDVIIPNYAKTAKFLERSVQSVAAAAVSIDMNVKVIVVDSDLLPETPEAQWSVQFPGQVQVVRSSRPALGIEHARIVGYLMSSAPWLTFLDADDEIAHERLATLRANFQEMRVIIGQQRVVDERGQRLSKDSLDTLNHPPFYINSMLVPRAAMTKAMRAKFTETKLSDDWALLLALRAVGAEIVTVNLPFVIRHLHRDNASQDLAAIQHGYFHGIRNHLGPKESRA